MDWADVCEGWVKGGVGADDLEEGAKSVQRGIQEVEVSMANAGGRG